MSELTKKAIIESFSALLNTRPLDQITVTDIAKKSGISRRTFYYYYQDIYQLPEELFLSETKKILKEKVDFCSWENWILKILEYAYRNKRAIAHVYNSVRREYLERFIFGVADNIITDYIDKQADNMICKQSDIDMLAAFYTNAIVGMALNWIGRGMKEEPESVVQWYIFILKGTIQCALNNCANKQTDSFQS